MATIEISLMQANQVNEIFMDGKWSSFGIEQTTSTTYEGEEDEMYDFIETLKAVNIEIVNERKSVL